MKKFVMMGLLVLSATPAFAKVSSKVTVASDFIWRGISVTNSSPTVQGGINYMHDSGLVAGVFASNQSLFTTSRTTTAPLTASPAAYLFNPFLMYGQDFGDFNVTGMLVWFNFAPANEQHNQMEYAVSGAWKGLKLSLNYMAKYFGYESSALYANLSYKFDFDKDFGVLVAFGSQTFGDETKTPWAAYTDWKLAVQHASADGIVAEVGLTDAMGLKLNVAGTKVDTTATMKSYVSLTKSF